MDEKILLEECPICRGAGMIMHEGGWSVQVEQTDGTLATYAGLSCAGVTQGQSVTRGAVLGVLGEIPCEAELGAHLHYALMRDGAHQDPAPLLDRASRR